MRCRARPARADGATTRGPGGDATAGLDYACDGEPYAAPPVRLLPGDLDSAIDPCLDLDAHVNARWRARTPVPADLGCWDAFACARDATLRVQRAIAEEAAAVMPWRHDPAVLPAVHAAVVLPGAGGGAGEAPSGVPTDDIAAPRRVVGTLWRRGVDLEARERAGLDVLADDLAAVDALAEQAHVAAFIDATHARGETLLWTTDVVPDLAEPTQRQLRIVPARGIVGRADHVGVSRDAVRRRRLGAAYCAGLLARAGCTAGAARQQAAEALALEHVLASAMPDDGARDVTALHRPLELARALRELAPLSLDAWFAAAGAPLPARVSLPAPGFHALVARLLADRPLAQWQAWLRVRLLDAAAPDLDGALRALHHRYHGQALRGLRREPPVWKQVLGAIDRTVPDAMAQLYVLREVQAGTRPCTQVLFEALRTSLHARLAGADWLGAEARQRALAKVEGMRALLVAPDRWPCWSGLATESPGFLALLRAARAHDCHRRLRRLALPPVPWSTAGPTHADHWSMPAHRVNARYDPQRNCIEVPAGLLQAPFFDPDAGMAALHGAIGAVLAHEMSHGFDDQGRRFDAAGRLGDGWPDADVAAFDRRAEAMAAWFGPWPDGAGGRLDVRRMLGENLADITGLAVAWDAFQARSGEHGPEDSAHRFFIAWAAMWRQVLTPAEASRRAALDHHAPAWLRANAAPRAMPAFRQAMGGKGGPAASGPPAVW